MKAEMLIRVTSHAQSLDNLTYTGKKDKKITAQGYVCGLHVHTNMQVIPRTENSKKHNKFEL